MLTVTIDQSESISGAHIPEKAVKKTRTDSAALSLPSPRAFSHFFLLNDFSPLSRSLEQTKKNILLKATLDTGAQGNKLPMSFYRQICPQNLDDHDLKPGSYYPRILPSLPKTARRSRTIS